MLSGVGTLNAMEGRVEIESGPLPMPALLAAPDGWPPGPAVVVAQEFWGLDDHIEDVARRLSGEGFAALAPDLYRGRQPTEPNEARKLSMQLERKRALADLRSAVSWLFDRGATSVGAIGFCMGGGLTWSLALEDERVGAAVPFYGAVELEGRELRVPVMAHYADHDRFSDEMLEQVRARIGDERFFRYPGTNHAFFNDTRERHDREASALAWERTIAFLREHLG
jgi:carboxymethylenebutenolidase